MNLYRHHISLSLKLAVKPAAFFIILLLLSLPAYSQNTKGDQPVNNKTKVRETRFKTRSKQGDRSRTKDIAGRRLRTKNQSSAGRAVINYKPPKSVKAGRRDRGDRAAKPIHPINIRSKSGEVRHRYPQVRNTSSRPKEREAPAGKATRVKVRSTTGKIRNVYSQSWRYVRSPKKPADKQKVVRAPKINVRSSTGKIRNVYPQSGRYVNNSSKQPRNIRRVHSNQSQLAFTKRFQNGDPDPGGKKRKIIPRSATRAHVGKHSINPYARFHRKKKKGEQAHIKDIAGQPLRKRNFESRRPEIVSQPSKPYYNRKRIVDRPYRGSAVGRHVSATRTKPRAWRGDIAGRKIRGKNHETKIRSGGGIPGIRKRASKPVFGDKASRRLKGGGYKTATRSSEKRTGKFPLSPRVPGIGATGIEKYQGTLKAKRPEKGGGSRSGILWNNRGNPISVRTPSAGAARAGSYNGNLRRFSRKGLSNQGEEFSGHLKARRPEKGGKSISGKLWNNQGSPIPVRTPSTGAARAGNYSGNIKRFSRKGLSNQGEEFTGYLKARRPEKGGKSISGKLWNNRGIPIPVRTPSAGAARAGNYSGNIKRFSRGALSNQGEEFTGHIKARRPEKGGKSISGKLWNNQETPIPVRTPSAGAAKAGNYSGNIKRFNRGTLSNQGEEFTGHIKARRPVKGGKSISGKLWNNRETPIPVRTPSAAAAKAGNYPGNIRRFSRSPGFQNQGEEFTGYMKVKRPTKGPSPATRKAAGYTGTVKDFGKILSNQGEEFTGHVRLSRFKRNYIRNKNAADEAPKKARPTVTTFKMDNFRVRVEQHKYVSNRSSVREALKAREPGKALGKAMDYQGNIKMKKFELFERQEFHPDTKFIKANKNNVAEERSLVTSIKLAWSRLFRKNETQPDHLKSRERKPRYDKGEQGLWYD